MGVNKTNGIGELLDHGGVAIGNSIGHQINQMNQIHQMKEMNQ